MSGKRLFVRRLIGVICLPGMLLGALAYWICFPMAVGWWSARECALRITSKEADE